MVQKVDHEGFVLGESLLYEAIKIPYRSGKRMRTYVVDFYAPERRIIWELTWSTHRGRRKKIAKAAAAVRYASVHGLLYHVVDEREVPRITLRQAAEMSTVDLDPRSRRRLARLKRR